MQLTLPHRKFVNKLLSGATAKDAYLHAFPHVTPNTARAGAYRLRNKPYIQAELARLRQKADSLPDSDFLTYVETRKYFARVLRAQVALLPDDSDLWIREMSAKGTFYLRFPDKLRILAADAKLAGYDRPKPDSSAESDQLTALLTRIRQSGPAPASETSASPPTSFTTTHP